ncbi:MAG: tRNA (adenosine(37)-N6)-dimethylallyltransferase MiaA [Firmicutes bacterium]|nr:tRNA (adenosine(37)-N6)-dimethylallyltransferase MiaA [Bacillota bacterium]
MIGLLVIVGPTAVGKSRVAVEIARRMRGEIISADSMQVYRGLDIGTAKPTLAERQGIPHHLIDLVEPDDDFTVVDFQRLAGEVIERTASIGRLPILVGGTGLYVKAILEGYSIPETAGNQELRHELAGLAEDMGPEALHALLARVDESSASRIHPHDLRRIIRALEVYKTTGTPISLLQNREEGAHRYRPLIVGLSMARARLYRRIEERVDIMLSRGWVNEVEQLLAGGCGEDLKPLQGLGYKHLVDYLRGRVGYPAVVSMIKRDTRRYAKRQMTWFRRDPRIHWISVDSYPEPEVLLEEIVQLVASRINVIYNTDNL